MNKQRKNCAAMTHTSNMRRSFVSWERALTLTKSPGARKQAKTDPLFALPLFMELYLVPYEDKFSAEKTKTNVTHSQIDY